jgi:hypothetical protein
MEDTYKISAVSLRNPFNNVTETKPAHSKFGFKPTN